MKYPNTTDPSWLYGQDYNQPEVLAYLRQLDPIARPAPLEDQLFWRSHAAGVSLELSRITQRISHVIIYAGRGDGARYGYVLPREIDFDMTRSEVQALLGKPKFTGPKFDTWEESARRLSVIYTPGQEIKNLSVFGAPA